MLGGLYIIGFDQGPEKLNDGSGKAIHPGAKDRGFTVSTTERLKMSVICRGFLRKRGVLPLSNAPLFGVVAPHSEHFDNKTIYKNGTAAFIPRS
jgi:hypothetical protein